MSFLKVRENTLPFPFCWIGVTFLCPKITVWRLLKGYTCALQIDGWRYSLLRLALTQLDSGWLLLFWNGKVGLIKTWGDTQWYIFISLFRGNSPRTTHTEVYWWMQRQYDLFFLNLFLTSCEFLIHYSSWLK